MSASPVRVSGISVGCFLPKVKSALSKRPPTLINTSVLSMKGVFDRISYRSLFGNVLIEFMPLGQVSLCMFLSTRRVASGELEAP